MTTALSASQLVSSARFASYMPRNDGYARKSDDWALQLQGGQLRGLKGGLKDVHILKNASASPGVNAVEVKRKHARTMHNSAAARPACEGVPTGQQDAPNAEAPESADRRSFLLGLAATSLWIPSQAALADPVTAPLPANCAFDPSNGGNSDIGNCCLPVNRGAPVQFQPRTDLPIRTRYAISRLQNDPTYIAKYTLAYQRMKALPASDPRSFVNQAKVHCNYCSGAEYAGYDIHGSYLFFPWHRWYLYFHERILATLIQDDTFTLPFWDWDSAAGRKFPTAYGSDRTSALFDAARLPLLDRTSQMRRFQGYFNRNLTPAVIQSAVLTVEDTDTFFGQSVASNVGGSVEFGPHGEVHNDVGSQSTQSPPPTPPGDGTDMGVLQTAARDPIFYAHHANIDRLWDVWLGLKIDDSDVNRRNPTDPDWLNSQFSFYDENANLVIVSVADTVDFKQKLRYQYDPAYVNEWATTRAPVPAPFRPPVASSGTSGVTFVSFTPEPVLPNLGAAPEARRIGPAAPSAQPIPVGTKPLVLEVERDPEKGLAANVEIVTLQGVSSPMNRSVCLRVFLNLPQADVSTPVDVAEFLGFYQTIPHTVRGMDDVSEQNVRFNIHRNLAALGATGLNSVTITIVPVDYDESGRNVEPGEGLAAIKGVEVEYL